MAPTRSTSSGAARSSASTASSSTTSTSCGSSTGSSRPLGRRIDQSSPRVDARLPDGSRVNAIIPPLSLVGPVITIRKFSTTPFTVEDLIGFGTATAEMFDFLRACVEARLNVFVSGGTGSGKTTTLNVLSSFIPEDERIVTIEDAAELQLAPAARRDARGAAPEPRGPRRDHDPRPAAQRPPHAPRPDHRRRVPLGRGPRHGPGHDDRPGRLALHGPRQQPAGHAPPPRDDGPHGRGTTCRCARSASRSPRRSTSSSIPPASRTAPARSSTSPRSTGSTRTRSSSRTSSSSSRPASSTGRSRADLTPTGVRPTFMGRFAVARHRPAGGRVRHPARGPGAPDAARARGAGASGEGARGRMAARPARRPGPGGDGRRHGLRLVDRARRPGDRPARYRRDPGAGPAVPRATSRRSSRRRAARSRRSSGPTGPCATPPSSTRSTRSGCAGSRATRRSARGR